MNSCKILAHRGASAYAPENTMAAFKRAADLNADGLEIDIHITKDNRIVVIHDETIDRTSNSSGAVADYDYTELAGINFNKGFESDYPEAAIPLLEEVLMFIKKQNMILNIEVKDIFLKNGRYTDLGIKASEMVKNHDAVDQVIFSSFNHHSMVNIKENYPEIKTALLYFENLYKAGKYAQTAKADAVHPMFLGVFRETVEEAHSESIEVNPWTVDDPAMIKHLINIGVDHIITNKPDVCRQVISGEIDPGEEKMDIEEYFRMMSAK